MIYYGLNKLVAFLGGRGTTIFATFIFLIIIRVAYAFVIKIFKGVHYFRK